MYPIALSWVKCGKREILGSRDIRTEQSVIPTKNHVKSDPLRRQGRRNIHGRRAGRDAHQVPTNAEIKRWRLIWCSANEFEIPRSTVKRDPIPTTELNRTHGERSNLVRISPFSPGRSIHHPGFGLIIVGRCSEQILPNATKNSRRRWIIRQHLKRDQV